ncbi:MAG: cytochrome c [Polyangiales bacterium]
MKTGLSLFAKTLAVCGLMAAMCACGKKSESASEGAESAGGDPSFVIEDQGEWDQLAEAGKTSFDTACGDCHPDGESDLGPALKDNPISSKKMVVQIREGSGQMKPIGEDDLPEEEMKGLLVYLATLNAVSDVKGP